MAFVLVHFLPLLCVCILFSFQQSTKYVMINDVLFVVYSYPTGSERPTHADIETHKNLSYLPICRSLRHCVRHSGYFDGKVGHVTWRRRRRREGERRGAPARLSSSRAIRLPLRPRPVAGIHAPTSSLARPRIVSNAAASELSGQTRR